MFGNKKILLVGSSNMNLSLNIARLPDKGESLKDEGGVSYSPGGSGGNSAVAFSNLGAEPMLVTRLGADLYGQKLYSYYKESGINTSYIKVDKDSATGLSVTISEADGSKREIVFPGANEALTADAVEEAIRDKPDALFVSFEASFQIAVRAANIAVSAAVPVFVSATPADANYPMDSLPQIEVFTVDEEEAKRYTGIRPSSSQDSLRMVFALWRKVKAKYIVINQYEKGAMLYDGKRCEVIHPFRYDRAVDKGGANDTFAAACCAEYLRTNDIKDSVRYAVAACAVSSARHGTAGSVPTDAELRGIIAQS